MTTMLRGRPRGRRTAFQFPELPHKTAFPKLEKLEIPDPITFVISPKWLNRTLYPRQATLMKVIFLRVDLLTDYDRAVIAEWEANFVETGNNGITPGVIGRMEALLAENEDDPDPATQRRWFREVLLILGRRAGKGYVSALAMAYVLWHYMAVPGGDPQEAYGIDRDKRLMCLIYAGKKEQARDNLWRDLVNVIQGGPCFAPYLSKNPLAESLSVFAPADRRKEQMLRARGVMTGISLASFRIEPKEATTMAGRGGASFMIGFDEMAHAIASGANRSADEMYKSSTPSLDQFKKRAFIVEPSSPWEMAGQFYVNAQHAVEVDEDGKPVYPEMLLLQLASWEIYLDWEIAHELELFPADFSGDLDEYVDDAEVPHLAPLKIAIQAYDEEMKRLEKSDPDMFAVERLSHWQVSEAAYLDPARIADMFAPWQGRELQMTYRGALSLYFKGHADPSKVNDMFGLAVAHLEKDPDTGYDVAVFDLIKHWDPADFPDHTIDYVQIIEEIWDIIKGFPIDDFSFDQFNCILSTMRIATDRGWIKVEDLIDPDRSMQPGDVVYLDERVQTRDGHAQVKVGYRKGRVQTIVAKTKPGYRIEATSEHRVLVRPKKARAWDPYPEPEWRTMGDLTLGDQLLVKRNGGQVDELLDISAFCPDESSKGTALCSSGRWSAYGYVRGQGNVSLGTYSTQAEASEAAYQWRQLNPTLNRITRFPTELTPELAEAMGLLSAEGDLSPSQVRFGNKDKDVLARYQELMEATFNGDWSYDYTDEWMGRYSFGHIRSGSRKLAQFMDDLGLGGLAQQKAFPESIYRSPDHVVAAYLRGLFEGDGGVTQSPADRHIALTSTSEQLARGTHLNLLRLGIFSTLWEGKYTYKGTVRPQWRVKIFGEGVLTYQQKIGFSSRRKSEQLQHLVDEVVLKGTAVGLRGRKSWEGEDSQWFTITALTPSEGECYDMTVPGQENFVAEGIVTHNSAYFIAELTRRIQKARLPKRMSVREQTATAPHNLKVAESFKIALNQGWVKAPFYEQANNELRYLQYKNGKVTHMDRGPVQHDDVARSMMETVFGLLENQIHRYRTGENGMGPISGNLAGGIRPWMAPNESDNQVFTQFEQLGRNKRMSNTYSPTRGPRQTGRPGPGGYRNR